MAKELLKVVSAKELPMSAEKFVRILDAMTIGLLFTYFQTPELITENTIITAFEALA
jgi:outer membrane protein W